MTPVTPSTAAMSDFSASASASVRPLTITRVFGMPEPNSSLRMPSATVLSASGGR